MLVIYLTFCLMNELLFTWDPACLIHHFLPQLLHRHVVAQVDPRRLTCRQANLNGHCICFDDALSFTVLMMS